MNEHGLIISDYNSRQDYTPCISLPDTEVYGICIPLTYQGRYWILVPKSSAKIGKSLRIHGVALTQSGRELFKVVEIAGADRYSEGLVKWFGKQGFRMSEVNGRQPRAVNVDSIQRI